MERWQRIESLFELALDRPVAEREEFLRTTCAGDAELYREVASLVSASSEDWPDDSWPAVAAQRLVGLLESPSADPVLEPGTRIGPYAIIDVVGAGAMGRVYRARDSRLERDVAITVLPVDADAPGRRLHRVRQEARALGALNYPNVAAIYDVIERAGAAYLVLEFVEGRDLAACVSEQGALPVREVLAYARQIAAAMQAAHDAGIVHRDLKPSNIKVTADGRIKVLDFGLAKMAGRRHERSASGGADAVTGGQTTLLAGTPAYMSPEQVAGEKVDGRADVWALGCVLYELLTGPLAFPAAGVAAPASGWHTVPDWRLLPPSTPDALTQIIRRCLERDAAERLADARVVRAGIESITEAERTTHPGDAPAGSPVQPLPPKPVAHPLSTKPAPGRTADVGGIADTPLLNTAWKRLVAAGLLLAVVGAVGYRLATPGAVDPPRAGRTEQLTFAPALEIDPAISPDGKLLAYASRSGDRTDVYVLPLAGGEATNLTSDDPGSMHRWPRWSPDGTTIALVSTEPGEAGMVPYTNNYRLRLVSYPGGRSRQVATTAMLGHSWSPDGKRLAYMRDREVWISSVDGASGVKVVAGLESHSPSWSPDGRWIAFVAGNRDFNFSPSGFGNQATSSVMIVPVAGGQPRRVTDQVNSSLNPVWAPDSRSILFISNRDRGGSREIFRLALSDTAEAVGAPVRITSGLNPFLMALSADGRKLAYATFRTGTNLWALPIPESPPVSASLAKPVTTGAQSIEGVSVSRNGEWIAFDSNRGGNADIYRMRRDGGTPERLTDDPSDDFLPSWSPDGKQIAFYSFRNGSRDIYLMAADGTGEEPLTNDPAQERYPVWSPDGQSLVFFSDQTGTDQLYTLAFADGRWGRPRQLTNDRAFWPDWSPDGASIAYNLFLKPPNGGIAIIPATGGERRLFVPALSSRVANYPRWSRDGSTIYFKATDAQGNTSLWGAPVHGGSPRPLVVFDDPSRPSPRPEFAVSDREFIFTLGDTEADVWMMSLED